jgi:nucleoside-diphosphate-sugar epimerase
MKRLRAVAEWKGRQRKPDISRAKETLGWSPRWKLEDGLEPTFAYFKKLLD